MAFNKEKVMDRRRAKFVEKGQIDKAIKEYLKIVPRTIRRTSAIWLKIGDLYAKKGTKQEATETYLQGRAASTATRASSSKPSRSTSRSSSSTRASST